MGRINKKKESKSNKEFKEFKVVGNCFQYTGRLYPAEEGNRHFMYLCLNEGITIQCTFVVTDNTSFISFPSWKNKKDEWKSYIYTDECMNGDLDNVCEALEALL